MGAHRCARQLLRQQRSSDRRAGSARQSQPFAWPLQQSDRRPNRRWTLKAATEISRAVRMCAGSRGRRLRACGLTTLNSRISKQGGNSAVSVRAQTLDSSRALEEILAAADLGPRSVALLDGPWVSGRTFEKGFPDFSHPLACDRAPQPSQWDGAKRENSRQPFGSLLKLRWSRDRTNGSNAEGFPDS